MLWSHHYSFSLYKTSNHTLKTLDNHVPLHRYPLVVNTSFKSQGSWLQVTETLLKLVKAKKKKKDCVPEISDHKTNFHNPDTPLLLLWWNVEGFFFFFEPDNSGALGSDGWPVGLYPRAPVSSKHSYLAASPSLCLGFISSMFSLADTSSFQLVFLCSKELFLFLGPLRSFQLIPSGPEFVLLAPRCLLIPKWMHFLRNV